MVDNLVLLAAPKDMSVNTVEQRLLPEVWTVFSVTRSTEIAHRRFFCVTQMQRSFPASISRSQYM